MSESQSRYSIVERLTQRKIEIITEDLELDEDIQRKEQKIEQLKKEMSQWEKDIEHEIERTRLLKQREIEKLENAGDMAIKRKVAKQEALKDKIKAVDKALDRIEEISKTSTTTQ